MRGFGGQLCPISSVGGCWLPGWRCPGAVCVAPFSCCSLGGASRFPGHWWSRSAGWRGSGCARPCFGVTALGAAWVWRAGVAGSHSGRGLLGGDSQGLFIFASSFWGLKVGCFIRSGFSPSPLWGCMLRLHISTCVSGAFLNRGWGMCVVRSWAAHSAMYFACVRAVATWAVWPGSAPVQCVVCSGNCWWCLGCSPTRKGDFLVTLGCPTGRAV